MIAYTRPLIDAFKGTTLERETTPRRRAPLALRRAAGPKTQKQNSPASTQAHTVSYQLITLYTDS